MAAIVDHGVSEVCPIPFHLSHPTFLTLIPCLESTNLFCVLSYRPVSPLLPSLLPRWWIMWRRVGFLILMLEEMG